ncbi:WYL domain-containing protein [Candidatus Pacearchaeota archaeon]|nr:WYL domain-containing protein [Candidatus Pacearchaeota archaeon]
MVYLSKKDAEEVAKALSESNDKKLLVIANKIKNHKKAPVYFYDKDDIKRLLRKAFREKRSVKINYYSHMSDEVTNRIIDVYQLHDDCVIAYCHLRNDERVFRIDRINKAAILDEKYKIPKGWEPESIILNK